MAVRRVHNKIAKMVVSLPEKDIDNVNRMVDDRRMLKKYGKSHRKHWGHNPNPHATDSLLISRGDAEREKARRVHILVDTDPEIKKLVEFQELRDRIRRL